MLLCCVGVGAATGAKPWEGPLMVLDAAACSTNTTSRLQPAAVPALPPGLLLQPCLDPLQLQHTNQFDLLDASIAAAAGAVQASTVSPAAAGGELGAAAAAAAAGGANDAGEVVKLHQQVQQLQQQLQDARQVAEQWQSLHGQLQQFCTEQVLAAP
jgi:hypothetical protein